jgi:hypothetical protein
MSTQVKLTKTESKEEIVAVAMIHEKIVTDFEKITVYPVTIKYLDENGEIKEPTTRQMLIIDELVEKLKNWINWLNNNQNWINNWLNNNQMLKYEVRLWSY